LKEYFYEKEYLPEDEQIKLNKKINSRYNHENFTNQYDYVTDNKNYRCRFYSKKPVNLSGEDLITYLLMRNHKNSLETMEILRGIKKILICLSLLASIGGIFVILFLLYN
jgi:hypothetical protein